MTERRLDGWGGVRVRVTPDATSQEFDGETVIVDLRAGEYYGLDGVGAVLWQLLKGGTTLNEMVAAVTLRYEVDEGTCLNDVVELLDKLFTARLIEVAPD